MELVFLVDRRNRLFVVTALVALSMLAGRGYGQAPSPSFEGEWVFAGGERERRRVDAAIDSVVAQLNVFIRGLARSQLEANVRPERRIVLALPSPDAVVLTFDGWGPHRLALDGRPRRVRGPDGSDTRLSAVYEGERIVIRQDSPRGLRESWLSLSDRSGWLFMQVRISSEQLPSAIRYTLTYRRRGGAGSS